MAHRGIALVGILVLTGGFFCWLRLPSEARGPSTGNSQLLRDLVLHQRITGTGRILEGPPYQEAMAVVHHRRRSSHGAEEIAIDAAAGRVTIDGPRANGPPRASPLSARQHGCSICIDGERIRDLTLPVGEACVEPATGNEVGNSVYWPLRTPNLHGKSCVEAGHARVTITCGDIDKMSNLGVLPDDTDCAALFSHLGCCGPDEMARSARHSVENMLSWSNAPSLPTLPQGLAKAAFNSRLHGARSCAHPPTHTSKQVPQGHKAPKRPRERAGRWHCTV